MKLVYERWHDYIQRLAKESMAPGKRRITEILLDNYEWSEFISELGWQGADNRRDHWDMAICPPLSLRYSPDDYAQSIDIIRITVRRKG